jgi:protein-L-isoaspartate(D-aspartate) O-methyltransferase
MDKFMNSNYDLVQEIKNKSPFYIDNVPRSDEVLNAMMKVDRIDFLPPQSKQYAYIDNPASIGYGQTCSQPSMVAFMLDKLEIVPGSIILEIGAGCGYASAISSILCKPDGFVYASEIIPELSETMYYNLASYMENIKIISKDGSAGFPEYGLFDRIFFSAGVASQHFDNNILIEQLNDDGILLYPESYGNIYKIKKTDQGIKKETYYGVSFVPLMGKNS